MVWTTVDVCAMCMQAGDYWFWIPWLMPHVGGILGAALYKILIELHHPPEDLVSLASLPI